jgi:hypothetical protein
VRGIGQRRRRVGCRAAAHLLCCFCDTRPRAASPARPRAGPAARRAPLPACLRARAAREGGEGAWPRAAFVC